jgi:hypothetical protein
VSSGFLPNTEMTAIRAVVTASLDLSCQIQRKTAPTQNADGYQVDNYTTIATVNCNLTEPTTAMLQSYASLIGADQAYKARFSWNIDVKRDDQLIISGLPALRVQMVDDVSSYSADTTALVTVVR